MLQVVYVATIQVAIKAENPVDASEIIHTVMEEARMPGANNEEPPVFDWGYLRLGSQYCYPTAQQVPGDDEYEEGDFLHA